MLVFNDRAISKSSRVNKNRNLKSQIEMQKLRYIDDREPKLTY